MKINWNILINYSINGAWRNSGCEAFYVWIVIISNKLILGHADFASTKAREEMKKLNYRSSEVDNTLACGKDHLMKFLFLIGSIYILYWNGI